MSAEVAVTGFLAKPLGHLCTQTLALDGELAWAHERARFFCKQWHAHDRTMLVCPLGASQMRLTWAAGRRSAVIGSGDILWMEAGVEHQTEAKEGLYDAVAFYPSATLRAALQKKQGPVALCGHDGVRCKRRTPLLNELVRRFVEIHLSGASASQSEIAALQWLLLCTAARYEAPAEIATLATTELPRAIAAAVTAVEGNLAAPWDLRRLAKNCATSRATLVRQFRAALGVTPMIWVGERRMQEAAALLRHGSSVASVAGLVGYESASAFCHAFRRHYGIPPSRWGARGQDNTVS